MERMSGLFGKFMTPDTFKLQGFSRIINSEGMVLSEINDEEGIVYSEIDITGNKKVEYDSVPNYNGWIHEGSVFIRKVLAPLDIVLGRNQYRKKLKKFIKDHNLKGC